MLLYGPTIYGAEEIPAMKHNSETLIAILRQIDLGSSVAETDHLLETARVETSVFERSVGDFGLR